MPRGKRKVGRPKKKKAPRKKRVPRRRKKAGSSKVGGALARKRRRVGGAMSKLKKALLGVFGAAGAGAVGYGAYKSGKAVSGLYRGMEALHPSTSFFPKRRR